VQSTLATAFTTMPQHIALTTLVVADYDAAIEFYTRALRFELREDTPLAPGKRWVVVAPRGSGPASGGLLLAQAANAEQAAATGRQTGGRVALFLHTDDFDGDLQHMQAQGVRLLETPRQEAYGRVVVFADLYGNLWDLIEPAR
jgi:catechol 2,3-dioxygenase-like lactoylglutathione lyase family enzyme